MTISQKFGITILNRHQHDQLSLVDLPISLNIENDERLLVSPLIHSTKRDRKTDKLVEAIRLELISDDPESLVKLTSIGSTVLLQGGRRLLSGQSVDIVLPSTLYVNESSIALFDSTRSDLLDGTISRLPNWMRTRTGSSRDLSQLPNAPSAATLALWFSTLSEMQRIVGCSQTFFKAAARAVFDPGGLDVCMILLKQDSIWRIQSSYVSRSELTFRFDPQMVREAEQLKTTLFHDATKVSSASDIAHTPELAQSLVASPIFDVNDECVGMVYGIREPHQRNRRIGVRPLEAQFVSLIADSVSAAMVRSSMEAEAARSQVLLEQAFPPEVAMQLRDDTTVLEPKLTDITVMFCDLRDFTELAERIAPKLMYEYLAEVMDCFTNIVMKHQGVIIDYFGDGFCAFWNAPVSHHDHPRMACDAAMELQAASRAIDERWHAILDAETKIGIGIHTDQSVVGNSGSSRRIKYGPRGKSIALAQRLQNATKELGVGCVISESMALRVNDDYIVYKVCKSTLKGIRDEHDLYGLVEADCSELVATAISDYQKALTHFECGQFQQARERLDNINVEPDLLPVEILRTEIAKHQPQSTQHKPID